MNQVKGVQQMNLLGKYKIFSGEVSEDRKTVTVGLQNLADPGASITMVFPLEDWGAVRIGAELEISSVGRMEVLK